MFAEKYSLLVFGLIVPICIGISNPTNAMTLSGPIAASSVTVSGDVTMSSLSVTTLTVAGQLTGPAVDLETTGRVLQVKISSITSESFTTGSTTFIQVTIGMSQSITLSSSSNYVRVSITGSLRVEETDCPGYLTIYRDTTTNLGDPTAGLAMVGEGPAVQGLWPTTAPFGLSLRDQPGDTVAHTYSVYIRAACELVTFPTTLFGELVLEEIEQ